MSIKKKILICCIVVCLSVAVIASGVSMYMYIIPKSKKYTVDDLRNNGKDIVKVGVISDLQLPQNDLHPWDLVQVTNGGGHMIQAMRYFYKQDVDMIVFNGDVVNAPADYIYKQFTDGLEYARKEIYKDKKFPHIVYPMGNHEFFGPNAEGMFYRMTRLPLNTRTIINGYSFISISNSKIGKHDKDDAAKAELFNADGSVYVDGAYSEERIEFLAKQLKDAATEKPDQPIFVFIHMPVSKDIVGGHWATPQCKAIYDLLAKYPQAVLFTSHSHYPIADERSVVQKDFTMVNTGSASYFDLDFICGEDAPKDEAEFEKFVNGTHEKYKNEDYLINPEYLGIEKAMDVPFRNDVNQGLILEINTKQNSFTMQRVNFSLGLEFGEKFCMNKFTKADFTRTAADLQAKPLPTFRTDGKLSCDVLPDGRVRVKFDNANSDVVTKYYQYELTKDGDAKPLIIRFYAKNYYLGRENRTEEENIIYRLKEKGSYELRVYAVDSLQRKSVDYRSATFEIK